MLPLPLPPLRSHHSPATSPFRALSYPVTDCCDVCVRVRVHAYVCVSVFLARARALSLSLCEMCLSIRKTVRRGCARTASELAGERARDSASKRETSLNRRRRTGWKTTVYTMAHAHSNRARPRSKGCFRHLILSVGIASVIALVCEQNMHAVHVHAVRAHTSSTMVGCAHPRAASHAA